MMIYGLILPSAFLLIQTFDSVNAMDNKHNVEKMEYSFDNGFAKFKLCTNLQANFSHKEEKLNTFTIIWVVSGMVELLIDGILVPLNTHQITFITPQKEVQIMANHGDVITLQFNRAFYCIKENHYEVSCEGILYFGATGIPIIGLDSIQQIKVFQQLVEALKEEFEIIDTIQEEMLRLVLKKWLIKSTRIIKTQQTFIGPFKSTTELVHQFHILLEQNYRKFHKVSDYAQLLNKSPKTISNQFKLIGIESPSKLIQKRILLEAKRYLMDSNLSIKEVAFHLGFENTSAFSNYFKARISMTPGKFRSIYYSSF